MRHLGKVNSPAKKQGRRCELFLFFTDQLASYRSLAAESVMKMIGVDFGLFLFSFFLRRQKEKKIVYRK